MILPFHSAFYSPLAIKILNGIKIFMHTYRDGRTEASELSRLLYHCKNRVAVYPAIASLRKEIFSRRGQQV